MSRIAYEFGPFRVDASGDGRLLRDGNVLPLSGRPMSLLLFLLANRESYYLAKELLAREDGPYGGASEESNVRLDVGAIREALEDKQVGGHYEYIDNVKGRGYIFAKQVREVPLTGAGAADELRLQLETYIEEKSRGFVGREFVFLELERFMAENDRGYFVVVGEPGIGKTSLSAHLVKARRLARTTCLYHFNDELSGVVQPEHFLKNVCAQLVERHGTDFSAARDIPAERQLNFLLKLAASRLSKDERLVVVVDALDEAQTTEAGPNRLYLPPDLPGRIFFVVTTRPLVKQPLIVSCARQDFPLIPDSDKNLDDIRRYVKLVLERGQLLRQLQRAGKDVRDFIAALERKSEGNFMYLYYILPELERGELEFHDLPQGLEGYYERHWQKMKSRDLDAWIKYQVPVITVLAALPEFLTANDVAELAPGLSPAQVAAVLSEWRPFLRHYTDEGERRYRLYHLTFQEFLSKKEEVGEIDLAETRDHIIERLQQALRPLRENPLVN